MDSPKEKPYVLLTPEQWDCLMKHLRRMRVLQAVVSFSIGLGLAGCLMWFILRML